MVHIIHFEPEYYFDLILPNTFSIPETEDEWTLVRGGFMSCVTLVCDTGLRFRCVKGTMKEIQIQRSTDSVWRHAKIGVATLAGQDYIGYMHTDEPDKVFFFTRVDSHDEPVVERQLDLL